MNIHFEDLGIIDYKKAWNYQEDIHREIIRLKLSSIPGHKLYKLIFCEHPHVFTLGKSGNESTC